MTRGGAQESFCAHFTGRGDLYRDGFRGLTGSIDAGGRIEHINGQIVGIGPEVAATGDMGPLAEFADRIADGAPSEIHYPMDAVRDTWRDRAAIQAEAVMRGETEPMAFLDRVGNGGVLPTSYVESLETVEDYIDSHCDRAAIAS